MDINLRMGDSIMAAYIKALGVDGSWLKQRPQTTLLTGALQLTPVSSHCEPAHGLARAVFSAA